MKRVFLIAIAMSINLAFAVTVFSQETPDTPPEKTTHALKQSRLGTDNPLKVRVKVKTIEEFAGTVVNIDMSEKMITVAKRGIALTFDISNPKFNGYKDINEVKVGDYVSITSTDKSIKIAKTSAESFRPQVKKEEVSKPIPRPVPKPKKVASIPKETLVPKKRSPVRVRERKVSRDFRDVDNNQDGKISPIELSVIIPDLTMKQFREYDKNGNGYLDESEYNLAVKGRR
jgi:hypothetical protein